MLSNLQEHLTQHCDLELVCADGRVRVQGLIMVSLLPCLNLDTRSLEDCFIILPDITTTQLNTFIRSLLSVTLDHLSSEEIQIIRNIANIFSIKGLDRDGQEAADKDQHHGNATSSSTTTTTTTSVKTVEQSLGRVDIDSVTDDVIVKNFSDQESRLVCLVCYKLLPPQVRHIDQSQTSIHIYQPITSQYSMRFTNQKIVN